MVSYNFFQLERMFINKNRLIVSNFMKYKKKIGN